jgi:hypothetical protein
MTASKSLPVRPSLESLRKQAKRRAREASLPLREAQLVVAREYGYPGWVDLVAEVHKRVGAGLEWAAARADAIIHDNDVERLKQLIAEHPALLTWQGVPGGVLGYAVDAYGDSFDPAREKNFTRRECAEFLLDAGAKVFPSVLDGLIVSRARGIIQLFHSRGLWPRTPVFLAALGDLEGLRAWLDQLPPDGIDRGVVNDAFICACRFEHEATASFLLDRCIALDAQLGRQIDGPEGRAALISLIKEWPLHFTRSNPSGLWQAFLMSRVMRAIHDDDLALFTDMLRRESWLLGEQCVGFQVGLIERATLRGRGAFVETLLNLEPAVRRVRPPPPSQAIEFALTYTHPHLLPLLTRIWALPDDLPHAAGTGNLDAVKRWFDAGGRPLFDKGDRPATQAILDQSLAYAVLNGHYEIADFLLAHGADINTRWSSHEPASILHELVFRDNYEAMQFLIDRGIDMTIRDYRWNATAEGWARYGAGNASMGDWLAEAQRRREQGQ